MRSKLTRSVAGLGLLLSANAIGIGCSSDEASTHEDVDHAEPDESGDEGEDDGEAGQSQPRDAGRRMDGGTQVAPSASPDANASFDGMQPDSTGNLADASSDGVIGMDGSSASEGQGGMRPIDPPVPDECIDDVSPGDHTFTCQGITFLVMVDEICTKVACGLILDVHGGTMSGAQMRENTKLHELAPSKGYLVVHPSVLPNNAGGSWDLASDPAKMADFVNRMIKAFHADESRIHVTGFSMGSAVTFWFLCNQSDLLASTAPISGSSADQVTVAATGQPCIAAINADWQPRVPILFMSGVTDQALSIDAARERANGLVMRLSLVGGQEIDGDGHYTRKRWTGEDGMIFDYLEHDYGGQALLDGHCIPGGTDLQGLPEFFGLNGTSCTTGEINLHWGETVLQWFMDHPKR